MTWKELLADNRVERHQTSKQEIDALRSAVRRDLTDASVPGLSSDRRFTIAYNAVLLLAKMAVACAGYRVKGYGAHHTTFAAVELAFGKQDSALVDYFDRCRRKRNRVLYDEADVVSNTEAKELLGKATEFQKLIARWLAETHPELA